MRFLVTNRDEEVWTHNRHFIPGHWSLIDWFYAIKYDLQLIWYYYFGKYKIVDTTKYMKIPNTLYFILSKNQMDLIKKYKVKSYIFIPTEIGNIVKIINEDNKEIDITNYNTW